MKARVILKGLALILSLALLGYLFESSDLGNSINESWIDARVRGSCSPQTGSSGFTAVSYTHLTLPTNREV